MKLKAGKETDRRCVLDWLNEVYVSPSVSYSRYTDDEIRIFAHDALVLLNEQPELVRCKDCRRNHMCAVQSKFAYPDDEENWFCAYGKRTVKLE